MATTKFPFLLLLILRHHLFGPALGILSLGFNSMVMGFPSVSLLNSRTSRNLRIIMLDYLCMEIRQSRRLLLHDLHLQTDMKF